MKALFLGDSITEGFDLEKYFPGRSFVNHGISGFSSAELLEAMHEGWFANHPQWVFLCIGTNDLARDYQQTKSLDNILHLVHKIRLFSPPGVNICIASLFPTRHNPPRKNAVIDQLNLELHRLTHDEKIHYLHLNPFFKDDNGQLKREFTDDGLHLNQLAYKLWAEFIQLLTGPFMDK
ncbi:MAG: GDSL-type esterase/lipase family protein [Bacteroidota bacterium]